MAGGVLRKPWPLRTSARVRSVRLLSVPLLGALLLGVLLAGCARGPEQPLLFPRPEAWQGFLVEQSLPPFQALGAAQFSFRDQVQSGELLLRSQPGPSYLVQLRARVTGSLVMELRFDPRDLLVLDYARKTYFLGDNAAAERLRLFQVDVTAEEFQWLLTGRVLRSQFQAGEGRVAPEGLARFSQGGDEYAFSLDAAGLPTGWTKLRAGSPVFRVEYRSYLDVPAGGGATVRLPEKIRVYLGDPQPVLVLGISRYEPVPAAPIDFLIPQPVLDQFQPE